MHQLFFRRLEVHRDHITLDQFGYFGADHVRADELPGFLVEDHLDEALILAERNRLPIAHKGEATDTDLAAALFRPGLGEADRGDLRIAVSAAWDEVLVEGMRVQPLDRLATDHALLLGLVREHR